MNWISLAISGITSLFKTSDDKNTNWNWVTIILCVFSFILLMTIGYLQGQIKDLNEQIGVNKHIIELLKTTIDEQNASIEASKANYELISSEFSRLSSVIDDRYNQFVIKESEKFKGAVCEDKLNMLTKSFIEFKQQLVNEINKEGARK